jgi:hypothetical protein
MPRANTWNTIYLGGWDGENHIYGPAPGKKHSLDPHLNRKKTECGMKCKTGGS